MFPLFQADEAGIGGGGRVVRLGCDAVRAGAFSVCIWRPSRHGAAGISGGLYCRSGRSDTRMVLQFVIGWHITWSKGSLSQRDIFGSCTRRKGQENVQIAWQYRRTHGADRTIWCRCGAMVFLYDQSAVGLKALCRVGYQGRFTQIFYDRVEQLYILGYVRHKNKRKRSRCRHMLAVDQQVDLAAIVSAGRGGDQKNGRLRYCRRGAGY